MDLLVHRDEFREYTDEEMERAFAEREEKFDGTAKQTEEIQNLAQHLTRKRFTSDVLLKRTRSAMQALIDQGFWNEEHIFYTED